MSNGCVSSPNEDVWTEHPELLFLPWMVLGLSLLLQRHDLRAVPNRLRLMIRHLHTIASLVLFVNMLTLMLNHFTPSPKMK